MVSLYLRECRQSIGLYDILAPLSSLLSFRQIVFRSGGLDNPVTIKQFLNDSTLPHPRTPLQPDYSQCSQPEDLNMVTIQSIMNADLDSSTTEWIEAQLSAGALGVKSSTGEVKWNRLREGLQGVVHRLASEVSTNRPDSSLSFHILASEGGEI